MSKQSGQTLIETLVASFILVMGISAALALANYSLGATTNIKQQTIALGLAREGIEVVKNIRDTNWLKASLSSSCYDFLSGSNTAFCYQDWLNPVSGTGQDISASSGPKSFVIRFDLGEPNPWSLVTTQSRFGLDLTDAFDSKEGSPLDVYYDSKNRLRVSESNTGMGRAIIIEESNGFAPFNQNTGPRLKVTSHVWWSGKNCPISDSPPANRKCSVVLETYLTNWRNF